MTEAQIDEADRIERELHEEAQAEERDAERARRNELWDAGAQTRFEDEQRGRARRNEAAS